MTPASVNTRHRACGAGQRCDRGVARIRGAAGTGKTVVALHRAAILARRYPDATILVTSFVKSLCTYMEQQFQELPDPPNNVDFRNIHSLAHRLADGRVHNGKVSRAFDRAYDRVVPGGKRQTLTREYLKEEIRRVVKGRAATREEYTDTGRFERIGRGLSLKGPDRALCCDLRIAWDEEMAREGTEDFSDFVLRARDLARQQDPLYRCVVVDEAQDLTLVEMQFLRALVATVPLEGETSRSGDAGTLPADALTVLDDSAQRIYPGGFKPRWANLDYRNSSDTLGHNHRNSERIVEAARAVRGSVVLCRTDNDDGTLDAVEVSRGEGSRPRFVSVKSGESHQAVLDLVSMLAERGVRYDDIGVLMLNVRDSRKLDNFLRKGACPVAMIEDLKTLRPLGPGVRLGTFDRAKGMEFKFVVVLHLGADRFPIHPEDSPSVQQRLDLGGVRSDPPPEERELRLLNLQRLYVGMTRARDGLFLLAEPPACSEIEAAIRRGLIDDQPV